MRAGTRRATQRTVAMRAGEAWERRARWLGGGISGSVSGAVRFLQRQSRREGIGLRFGSAGVSYEIFIYLGE